MNLIIKAIEVFILRWIGARAVVENKEKHLSYATLSFSRCSASESKALFGSSIKHRDTIRMRINRAEIVRNLGRDWIHGNGVIAEVEMSYSQFAEAITAMNALWHIKT